MSVAILGVNAIGDALDKMNECDSLAGTGPESIGLNACCASRL